MFLNIPKWRNILPFREACTQAGFVNDWEPQLHRTSDVAGAAQPSWTPSTQRFACTPMDCLHVSLQSAGALYPHARLCSAFAGQRVPLCLCVVQGLKTPNPEAECQERSNTKICTWAGWEPKALGINVMPSKACPEILAAVSPARAAGGQWAWLQGASYGPVADSCSKQLAFFSKGRPCFVGCFEDRWLESQLRGRIWCIHPQCPFPDYLTLRD